MSNESGTHVEEVLKRLQRRKNQRIQGLETRFSQYVKDDGIEVYVKTIIDYINKKKISEIIVLMKLIEDNIKHNWETIDLEKIAELLLKTMEVFNENIESVDFNKEILQFLFPFIGVINQIGYEILKQRKTLFFKKKEIYNFINYSIMPKIEKVLEVRKLWSKLTQTAIFYHYSLPKPGERMKFPSGLFSLVEPYKIREIKDKNIQEKLITQTRSGIIIFGIFSKNQWISDFGEKHFEEMIRTEMKI